MKKIFSCLNGLCFGLLLSSLLGGILMTDADKKVLEEKQKQIAALPKGTQVILDQSYSESNFAGTKFGSAQNLDLYVPPGEGPFPLILWIHGGGWHSGAKDLCSVGRWIPAGFAIASVNYRLTVDTPFPAQIEDCFSALIWLRQNSNKYKIDPNKVVVSGHSAGAHLAALVAFTGNTEAFVKKSDVSTQVQAASLWSGPYDFDRDNGCWPKTTMVWNPSDLFAKCFFPSGAYEIEFAKKASPINYVRSGLPPIMILHGEKDDIVTQKHATLLHEALTKQGNQVLLDIQPGKDHSTVFNDATFQKTIDFFKKSLQDKK